MLKTILFDIDETLYSYTECHAIALEKIDSYCRSLFGWEEGEVKKYWKIVFSEVKDFLGFDNANIHDIMLRIQLILERKKVNPLPYARNITEMYWNTVIEHMTAYEWVKPFILEQRKKGYSLGLATDMTAEIQYRKLEKLELSHLFDFIVTSEEAGCEKPHKGIFGICLKKSSCTPEECLMIGDNWEKDMLGAIQMGMKYAWHTPGMEKKNIEKTRRDVAFSNLSQLNEIVEKYEK